MIIEISSNIKVEIRKLKVVHYSVMYQRILEESAAAN